MVLRTTDVRANSRQIRKREYVGKLVSVQPHFSQSDLLHKGLGSLGRAPYNSSTAVW